jgi:hypothetical protein
MKERIKDGSEKAYKRGRKGVVIFITSDKVIQSVLTGAVTAFVFSLNEGVAAYFQLLLKPYVPVYVPVKIYAAVGAILLFMAAYWADRNTDEWREYVRETTGEETAEDTAADEDVTGESK